MLLNHKPNEKVISIVFYGKSHKIFEIFPSFYKKCKDIFLELKYEYNYLSIDSKNFIDGKIKTVNRFEKKLIDEIMNKNPIRSICFFSLPNDFRNCGFDYNVSIEWNQNYLLFTFPNSTYKAIQERIIKDFKEFFEFNKIEIFKMSRKECPWNYVSGINPINSYKSLRILKVYSRDDIERKYRTTS